MVDIRHGGCHVLTQSATGSSVIFFMLGSLAEC